VCFGDHQAGVVLTPESQTHLRNKRKWLLSCASHAEQWRNRGGYWVGHLMGWCDDPTLAKQLTNYLDE
jgi:hypothetical protein